MKAITISFLLFFFSLGCTAMDHSQRAAEHMVQASAHASNSVIHAIFEGGRVVLAVASVPLGIAGLKESDPTPIGDPLKISDETFSVGRPGLPPDEQLNQE